MMITDQSRSRDGPGPAWSLPETLQAKPGNLKFCMLLPRCNPIHPRLCCAPMLRDFYATRPRLRKLLNPSQIEPEPITAKAKKRPSLKGNGRNSRKLREEKRKERKAIREGRLSATPKLSLLLRLHNKSARYPCKLGTDGLNTLPGHLGASEKDGGLPCPLYVVSSFAFQRSQFLMETDRTNPAYPVRYFIRVA